MSRANKIFNKIFEAELPDMNNDAEVFNNALDLDTQPDAFNTEPSAPGFDKAYIEKISKWIEKIQDLTDWLNGTTKSLNTEIIAMDKSGSRFEGISKASEQITRIAGDLAKMEQIFAGYAVRSNKEQDVKAESVTESFEINPSVFREFTPLYKMYRLGYREKAEQIYNAFKNDDLNTLQKLAPKDVRHGLSFFKRRNITLPEFNEWLEVMNKIAAEKTAANKNREIFIPGLSPKDPSRGTPENRYYDATRGFGSFGQAYFGD
jgi:hypothetical protein